MIPGYQALSSMEEAQADLRREERQITARLEEIQAKVSAFKSEETLAYRDLARFRMAQDKDGLAERLDHAGRSAADILDRRASASSQRHLKIDELEQRGKDLRSQRTGAAGRLIESSEAHARARDEVREELARDEQWQNQKTHLDQSEMVAKAAREKTQQALADRQKKGAPYENDPLFAYLWKREYGLSTYRASPPIRALDRWVARLADYQHARPNYAMLLNIPRRLGEHADRLEAEAEEQKHRLVAIEASAFKAGPTAQTAAALRELRDAIADLDRRLDIAGAELETLIGERDVAAAGEDDLWREVTDLLVSSLQSDSLVALWRDARRTPSPEDERLVERIERVQNAAVDLEAEAADNRKALSRISERRQELATLSRDFRERGWQDTGSVFGDNALTGVILSEFLRGAISAAQYWRQMESGHRWRQSRHEPDSGGGIDLGRDWTSGWSGPDMGPRRGAPRPAKDAFGSDDFITGGDF